MPTPQNGQAHSNKSLATADDCLSMFEHFVRLAFKGLKFVIHTLSLLIHLMSLVSFYKPLQTLERQRFFSCFQGGTERDERHEMNEISSNLMPTTSHYCTLSDAVSTSNCIV